MAQDVVFDSERLEKRERAKKLLIPAAVTVGILLLVMIAAVVTGMLRGKTVTGGEDTPYPFSWRANRDGVITLEIDRADAEGYKWNYIPFVPQDGLELEDMDQTIYEPVFSVESDAKQKEGKDRFILTPLKEGRQVITFGLCGTQGETDEIYEVNLLAEYSLEDGKTSSQFLSSSGMEKIGKLSGNGAGFFYEIYQAGDDVITITVKDTNEQETAAEPEPEPELPFEVESGPTESELEEDKDLQYYTVWDGSDVVVEPEDEPIEPIDASELIPASWQWEFTASDEEVLEIVGYYVSEDTVVANLKIGDKQGPCSVHFSNEILGVQIFMECVVEQDRVLKILTHDIITH